ncbi:capsid protein [Erinaceus virus H14]|nr:capsid protein [Erinaceus virus H14]
MGIVPVGTNCVGGSRGLILSRITLWNACRLGYMTPRRRKTQSRKPNQLKVATSLGTFRVRNRALLCAVIANTKNTTFPFGSVTVDLSKDGLARASLGWLANLMSLYDMFKIASIRLEWVPSVSAFASGSIAMYYDPTPGAKAPSSFAGVSGNANVVTTQVSKPIAYTVRSQVLQGRLPWFLTESEDKATASQGTIVVCQSQGSIPSATGDVMLGSVWITYDIMLKNPTYLAAPSRTENEAPPLVEQLIFDETVKMRDLLDRQVFAQEDTAESCQIIAGKPSIGASVSSDVTRTAAAVEDMADLLGKLDVTNINRLAKDMADPGSAPVIYRREGWGCLRTG